MRTQTRYVEILVVYPKIVLFPLPWIGLLIIGSQTIDQQTAEPILELSEAPPPYCACSRR